MQNIFRTITLATVVVFAATATASAQYTFNFDEGGWVDEDAGLVWGYEPVCLTSILNWDWNSSVIFADDYALVLFNNGLEEEAIIAAVVGGWRLPTIEEADAAWVKGLFTFARDPFLDPLDPCNPRFDIRRWTSSGKGKKKYVIYPNSGTIDLIVTEFKTFGGGTGHTFGLPLVVRPLTPPPPDDGGNGNGNGNGKGKNK